MKLSTSTKKASFVWHEIDFVDLKPNIGTKSLKNNISIQRAKEYFHTEQNVEKSPSLFALPLPLLQSFGLRPKACKLACMVEQTGGYNFYIKGKKKN